MTSTNICVLVDVSASMQESMRREGLGQSGRTKWDSVRTAVDRLVDEISQRRAGASFPGQVNVSVLGFGLQIPGHEVCDLLTLRQVFRSEDLSQASEDAERQDVLEGDGYREFRAFAESRGYEGTLVSFANRQLTSSDAHYLALALRNRPEKAQELERLIPKTKERAAASYTLNRMKGAVGFEDNFETVQHLAEQLIAAQRGEGVAETRERLERQALGRLGDQLRAAGPSTMTLDEAMATWSRMGASPDSLGQGRRLLFGNTPMCRALGTALDRFEELSSVAAGAVNMLFLLTDGQSTDGDPRSVSEDLRSAGVVMYTCFVADSDVTAGRRLYATPAASWTAPATVVFDIASPADPASRSVQLLREYGWQIDKGCRLFSQVNHTELLTQFTDAVLRDTAKGQPGQSPSGRRRPSTSTRTLTCPRSQTDHSPELR